MICAESPYWIALVLTFISSLSRLMWIIIKLDFKTIQIESMLSSFTLIHAECYSQNKSDLTFILSLYKLILIYEYVWCFKLIQILCDFSMFTKTLILLNYSTEMLLPLIHSWMLLLNKSDLTFISSL